MARADLTIRILLKKPTFWKDSADGATNLFCEFTGIIFSTVARANFRCYGISLSKLRTELHSSARYKRAAAIKSMAFGPASLRRGSKEFLFAWSCG